MLGELTDKQARVLRIIASFIDRHGRPPTQRDIMREGGFKSPRSAQQYVDVLTEKGFLRHDRGMARGLRVVDRYRKRIALVGNVPAGQPILAEQHISDWIDPLEGLSPGYGDTADHFAVRVVGDSMRDAGILDGDTVIVRRKETIRDGQIAVVYLDGEATVKRVRLGRQCTTLQPENPDFSPIVVSADDGIELRIAGPVMAVFRRYT